MGKTMVSRPSTSVSVTASRSPLPAAILLARLAFHRTPPSEPVCSYKRVHQTWARSSRPKAALDHIRMHAMKRTYLPSGKLTLKMQRHRHCVTFAFIAVFAAGVASGEDRCAGATVTEVRSLDRLPSQMRRLLPNSTNGPDGIADHGGRFNVTDVVDYDLPMRRFSLAAVGARCAVVAVEYGGRAHGFALIRLTDAGWHSVWRRTVFNEPKSTKDLLTDVR
jgi:hypothetical protein